MSSSSNRTVAEWYISVHRRISAWFFFGGGRGGGRREERGKESKRNLRPV